MKSGTTVLLIFALLFSGTTLAQITSLQVSLSAVSADFKASDALSVEFSLLNTSNQDIRVLKWGTPLEGEFKADMFVVTQGGTQIAYIGRQVKRSSPQGNDYLSLAPGESVTASIDLASGYAIYASGKYTVRFRDILLKTDSQVVAQGAIQQQISTSIQIQLGEDRPQPISVEAQQPMYTGCSGTEQLSLVDALQSAETIALQSHQALIEAPVNLLATATRYITWFGDYGASRYSTVKSNFDSISTAFEEQVVRFDCTCNNSSYAYVFPSTPYVIYLCGAFWSAPLLGTDSKAGTLIHEMSHFTIVAATNDHAYGQNACQALALATPSQAIENADSHEYFAENTPNLYMPVVTKSPVDVMAIPWLQILLD